MEKVLFETKGLVKNQRFAWSLAGLADIVWGIIFIVLSFVGEELLDFSESLRIPMMLIGIVLFLMGLLVFSLVQVCNASCFRITENGVTGIQPITVKGGLQIKKEFTVCFADIRNVKTKNNMFGDMLCIDTDNGSYYTYTDVGNYSAELSQAEGNAYDLVCEHINRVQAE